MADQIKVGVKGMKDDEGQMRDEEVLALIELHLGLDRQGPGDAAFSRHILSLLPKMPANPCIMDLGCGTGAATFLLAEHFNATVIAVDLSKDFLIQLEKTAKASCLDHLIHTLEADMGALAWPKASVDLLWSEGAAYILTFSGALKAWRPLLVGDGFAVLSEMTWFSATPPPPARTFWAEAYPAMGSEFENIGHAKNEGFEILFTERLPTKAWWDNYYNPLLRRLEALKSAASPIMAEVLRSTEIEIDLFRQYSDHYGYTFYILKAV
jgi:SAM-dependent methyltransferase